MVKTYSDDLISKIKKYNYIPKKINPTDHLKLYHRYWIPELGGVVKVKDIWKLDGIEYYTIKYKNDMMICFSYPIEDYCYEAYELIHDYNDIYKENIIGNNKIYTGAEIKYWFAYHNSSRYNKFNRYLNKTSKDFINDNRYYKVYITNTNKYIIEKVNK